MEYATMTGFASNEIRTPELGRLKAAAERVAAAGNFLDGFLYRFNGPRAESASGSPQPPDSYRNDLETLFEQINRLEAIVSAFADIG